MEFGSYLNTNKAKQHARENKNQTAIAEPNFNLALLSACSRNTEPWERKRNMQNEITSESTCSCNTEVRYNGLRSFAVSLQPKQQDKQPEAHKR